ncbi:serine hydrolase [Botrimarina mediterranea]|uniref:beta-lactamase n=1 Tax=Botrimarina mediterranea TaxID=2528022 RepID=A0A518K6U5_9BACT|nr:serine hydrolase [Botrimarina mediterranea]QDV73522.1 D-alanyl-D-alanine carboxypeptidase precursor [Botrimarina mediterranea]QDV78113.1 D-alanyl-D-alanine carboxypeptidase precursor [Planctomycetes bacterium K2D]
MWRQLLCLALVALVSTASLAKPTAQQALGKALRPMLEGHQGAVTVAIKHLETGETFTFDADRPMPSASMIKLPIMLTAYRAELRGDLSMDDKLELKESDKVPGSGLLTEHFTPGTELTLRDAIRLMMGWSDNTATNLVIEAIGRSDDEAEGDTPAAKGIRSVNRLMEGLGYDNMRLNSLVFRGDTTIAPERSKKFGLGVMTAAETIDLYEKIVKMTPPGFDEDEIEEARKEMLDHLRACQSKDTLPRLLPKGTTVAHKGGSVSASRCDGGVIESPTGPIAVCVMTTDNKDTGWGAEAEPMTLIAQVGKAAFDYFTEGAGAVDAPQVARVLRMGQEDPLVEPLQRTLNERLDPSPDLSVDGDFGPNTDSAVKAFQKKNGLKPTGEVDGAFWKALGPLVMEDRPAPAPEEAMKDLPPLKPQDPVTGPPVVSCAAWAIADGETGKLLWGYNDAGTRDPASTTKMMTAYVVLKIAEEDPKVLDEVITFSERADKTGGSTSAVKAGEKVTVRELLYGLMLPSGNDASVAFAEHFGDRLPGEDDESAYDRFIAKMNATAKELGMDGTGYRNTHGLTAEGHVTTAQDLVKLAHAAMQNELFRKVVATRRYATTLSSTAGYERNIVWNNTDSLLGTEGFYGVKTGTTGPAGACLVSAGKRGDKPLYVVILGASTGANRYLDARNLYRWAWNELGVE